MELIFKTSNLSELKEIFKQIKQIKANNPQVQLKVTIEVDMRS